MALEDTAQFYTTDLLCAPLFAARVARRDQTCALTNILVLAPAFASLPSLSRPLLAHGGATEGDLIPISGIDVENRCSFNIEARHNLASTDTTRLAVLIDADNASASVAKELLEEVAKFGTATVKRAFGDWTTQNLVGWKAHLHRHAIQPIQQFAYTQGKNSTDSAFIIDAMDLLYSGNVDGFCLVSSDSDFTRLATRLREAGKVVYGLGERKTPEPFIAACDKFIFFEVLKRPVEAAAPVQVPDVPDLRELLTHAIRETVRDSGWSRLSTVGGLVSKTHTSFDPRNYGFKKLSELVRAQPYLEVVDSPDGTGFVHVEVRLK